MSVSPLKTPNPWEPESQEPTALSPSPSTPTMQPLHSGADPVSTSTNARQLARRLFLPIAGSLLLVAALLIAAAWWQYQMAHVSTSNALVRSNLSELGLRSDGVIKHFRVRAGDTVLAGDVLAELDNTHLLAQRDKQIARLATLDQRIAVQAATIQLAIDGSLINQTRAESDYQQAQAEAMAARVRAEDARAFHAARQTLERDGAVAAETLRDAKAKAEFQRSRADAADAAVLTSHTQLLTAQLSAAEIDIQRGQHDVLKAERQEALAELARIDADIASTKLLAPAAGAVIRRLAQPGMAITTGMPVLSMWLTDDTWVEAWIPEERLGEITTGSEVSVTFPALPNERFHGRVDHIGLATDFEMPVDYLPQTRETRMRPTPQVGVRVRLDSPPLAMRPGMSAAIDIQRAGH